MAYLPQVSAEEAGLGINMEPRARSCGWGRTLLTAKLVHAGGNKALAAHCSVANRPMGCLLRAVPQQAQRSGPYVCSRIDLDRWSVKAHASNLLIEAEA